jgi:heat shock protein HtpX
MAFLTESNKNDLIFLLSGEKIMKFLKRILLFLAVNVLVVVTISLILNLLGVRPYLNAYGLDYSSLMAFCLVWGMGGAFISLALSRFMAKMLMGVRVIDPHTHDRQARELLDLVHQLARQAGMCEMPQVGIYESPEVNAFATGPSQRRSLVAVSRGLLNNMSHKGVEGVLAHEISHIVNGDMVTMTLLQGVVNAFVMFLARVLAYAFSGMGRSKEESSTPSYALYSVFVFVFEMVFMLLGFLVIAFFSRRREYRADAGGADLAGKEKMISALQSLQSLQLTHDPRAEKPAFQPLKISDNKKRGLSALFATHPPLEDRIQRLKEGHF